MRVVPFLLLGALATPAAAKDPIIAQAMEMLLRDDEDSGFAEKILEAIPDRDAVVAEAARALADDKPTILAKRRLLSFLLLKLDAGDLVTQALESEVVSTRRAAAAILAGLPAHATATRAILMAWIAQDAPDDIALAVATCRKAACAELEPHLWRIVESPETPPAIFADALLALAKTPSPRLAEFAKERLADPSEDETRVSACIDALASFPDLDADALLLPWLERREPRIPRVKAVFRIRSHDVLRAILLDPDETDDVYQRTCLYRLARELDDAQFLDLVRNPRVARHRYFAVRVDVATSLACLEGAGEKDVPLLLDYLVDEDPPDKQHLVRSEAWLTLWTLTGKLHGAGKVVGRAPPRGHRESRCSRLRVGVSPAQQRALGLLAKDLDHMREVRQAYAAK